MRRREFLGGAATGLAALALPARNALGGQFTGRIKKAVKYHMVAGNASVVDKFRLVKDLGFDGIETRVKLGAEFADEVRSYAEAREQTGLPIHGVIHSSNPTLKEAIDQAKMLGADSVLHVVRYDKKLAYLENYRQTQAIVRRAVEHAEKQSVMILIENVWATYLIEPLAMVRFLDEIDSPMVGAYFDVGNVVRWGWPQHWLEVLGKRTRKLDIKEYDLGVAMNAGLRNGFSKPLGEGSIEWDKVRAELTKIDYQGWATAEVKGGDQKRLAEIAEQMDRVLDL